MKISRSWEAVLVCQLRATYDLTLLQTKPHVICVQNAHMSGGLFSEEIMVVKPQISVSKDYNLGRDYISAHLL